jgi:hypothetical protein
MRRIRRLPKTDVRRSSTSVSTRTPRVYSAVPTPERTRPIVKSFSPAPKGSTSRKPTVEIVVIVW